MNSAALCVMKINEMQLDKLIDKKYAWISIYLRRLELSNAVEVSI